MSKIKKCPKCGQQGNINSVFCTKCGTKLVEVEINNSNNRQMQQGSYNNQYMQQENYNNQQVQGNYNNQQVYGNQQHMQQNNNVQASSEEKEEKTNNKLIIGIVCACVAVVLIAIAAIVALFFLRGNLDMGTTEETEQVSETASEEKTTQEERTDEQITTEEETTEETTTEEDTEQTVTGSGSGVSSGVNEDEKSDEYILPGSDSRYLSEADLEGLTAYECRLARNELFARHGRLFDDEELQAYFDSKSWYNGTIDPDDFDDSVFNKYEIANRDLIVEYEQEQGYR